MRNFRGNENAHPPESAIETKREQEGPDWPEGCPAEKPAARGCSILSFIRVPRFYTEQIRKKDALLLIARRDADTRAQNSRLG